MNTDRQRDAIVNAIIGDIREVITIDPDEIDYEIELTDEEIAEFDALPEVELAPEEEARLVTRGMELFHWLLYQKDMQKRGLPYVDRWEWFNMAVKPTAPEGDE